MHIIRYVQNDALITKEIIETKAANKEYLELRSDPSVTELEALELTIDVTFTSGGKEYTYLLDKDIRGYKYVRTPEGDTLDIVRIKTRTVRELKAMAKSRGFSSFKVLHGTAIK